VRKLAKPNELKIR